MARTLQDINDILHLSQSELVTLHNHYMSVYLSNQMEED